MSIIICLKLKARDEKYAEERKRLVKVLSKAEIGNGYVITEKVEGEVMPQDKIKSVLTDIRFGKDEQSRFLPSKVEFVFALTAVHTEIRINLVHNNSWSNYDRLCDIFLQELGSRVQAFGTRTLRSTTTRLWSARLSPATFLEHTFILPSPN